MRASGLVGRARLATGFGAGGLFVLRFGGAAADAFLIGLAICRGGGLMRLAIVAVDGGGGGRGGGCGFGAALDALLVGGAVGLEGVGATADALFVGRVVRLCIIRAALDAIGVGGLLRAVVRLGVLR